MEKIQLHILGISSGHTSSSYTLILEETDGERKLPIIIGAFEAQAIAIEIEKIVPVRPMTHDLFFNLATAFHLKIKEVLIHKLQDGVFYANIVCTDGTTEEEIDARTSDAIALALRFKCPIYTYEEIMSEAGIVLGDNDTEPATGEAAPAAPSAPKPKKSKDTLSSYSIEELEKMLEESLDEENYVLAAKIRDEIKKKQDH